METSKAMRWTGWALSVLIILFMLLDGAMKLAQPEIVVATTMSLGYPKSAIMPIGVILLVCTALYAFPRTAVLGAILLTAYLGGAVATHVRVGSPLFSHTLFGVYLGLMLWAALWLRDARLRALFPLRTP
ncbi:MAG: DoxX family protein [Hyphomonadaceae bacterium]|nr:DoxX family protein [Hyphomonadaceae bacterium]